MQDSRHFVYDRIISDDFQSRPQHLSVLQARQISVEFYKI